MELVGGLSLAGHGARALARIAADALAERRGSALPRTREQLVRPEGRLRKILDLQLLRRSELSTHQRAHGVLLGSRCAARDAQRGETIGSGAAREWRAVASKTRPARARWE